MNPSPAWIDGEDRPGASVDHPYFTRHGHAARGEEAAPGEDTSRTEGELLLWLARHFDCRPAQILARAVALRRVMRIEGRSLRECAKATGVSAATIHRSQVVLERALRVKSRGK